LIKIKYGFTLLELSMVLLIIGGMAAAITTGYALVTEGDLKKIYTKLENYNTSINGFYDDYGSVPGDMKNAYDYWGTSCANTGTPATDQTYCNGDGNRLIDNCATNTSCENFRFWQHLQLAGYISGSYDGVQDTGTNPVNGIVLSVNTPSGLYPNSGFYPNYITSSYLVSAPYNFFPNTNVIIYTTTSNGPTILATDTYSLDLKFDDGLPYSGSIIGYNLLSPTTCVTGSVPSAQYNHSAPGVACSVLKVFSLAN
jgi:prepilin-type N-terminal cleavage/methylation domain-containing protein